MSLEQIIQDANHYAPAIEHHEAPPQPEATEHHVQQQHYQQQHHEQQQHSQQTQQTKHTTQHIGGKQEVQSGNSYKALVAQLDKAINQDPSFARKYRGAGGGPLDVYSMAKQLIKDNPNLSHFNPKAQLPKDVLEKAYGYYYSKGYIGGNGEWYSKGRAGGLVAGSDGYHYYFDPAAPTSHKTGFNSRYLFDKIKGIYNYINEEANQKRTERKAAGIQEHRAVSHKVKGYMPAGFGGFAPIKVEGNLEKRLENMASPEMDKANRFTGWLDRVALKGLEIGAGVLATAIDWGQGHGFVSGDNNIGYKIHDTLKALEVITKDPMAVAQHKEAVAQKVQFKVADSQSLVNEFKLDKDPKSLTASEQKKLKILESKLSPDSKKLLHELRAMRPVELEILKHLDKKYSSKKIMNALEGHLNNGLEMATELVVVNALTGGTSGGLQAYFALKGANEKLQHQRILYDYYSQEQNLKELNAMPKNSEQRKLIEGILKHPNNSYVDALVDGAVNFTVYGGLNNIKVLQNIPGVGGVFKGIGGGTVAQALRSVMAKVGMKNTASFLAKNFADMNLGTRGMNIVKDIISEGLDMSAISAITSTSNEITEKLLFDKPINAENIYNATADGFVSSLYFSGPRSVKHMVGYVNNWYKYERGGENSAWGHYFDTVDKITHVNIEGLTPEQLIARDKARDYNSDDEQAKGIVGKFDIRTGKPFAGVQKYDPNGPEVSSDRDSDTTIKHVHYAREALNKRTDLTNEQRDRAVSIAVQIYNHARGNEAELKETLSKFERDIMTTFGHHSDKAKGDAKAIAQVARDILNKFEAEHEVMDKISGEHGKVMESDTSAKWSHMKHRKGVDSDYLKLQRVLREEIGHAGGLRTQADEDAVAISLMKYVNKKTMEAIEAQKTALDPNNLNRLADEIKGRWKDMETARNDDDHEGLKSTIGENNRSKVAFDLAKEEQSNRPVEEEAPLQERPEEPPMEEQPEGEMPQQEGEVPQEGEMPQEEAMPPTEEGMQPTEQSNGEEFGEEGTLDDVIDAQIQKEIEKMKGDDFEGTNKMVIAELVDTNAKEHSDTHEEAGLHIKHVGVAITRFNDQIEAVDGLEPVGTQYYDPASKLRITFDYDPEGGLEVEGEGDGEEEQTTGKYRVRIELGDNSEYTEDVADNFYDIVDAAHSGFHTWVETLRGETFEEQGQEDLSAETDRMQERAQQEQTPNIDISGAETHVIKVESRPTPNYSSREFEIAANPLIDKSKFEGGNLTLSKNWMELPYGERFPEYHPDAITGTIMDAIAITNLTTRAQRERAIQELESNGEFDLLCNIMPLKVAIGDLDFYVADLVTGKDEKYLKEKAKLVREFILGGGKEIPVAEVSRSFHNPTHLPDKVKITGNEKAIINAGTFQTVDANGKPIKWGGATVKLPSGAICTFPGEQLGLEHKKFIDNMASLIIKYVIEGEDAVVSPKEKAGFNVNPHGFTHKIKDIVETFFTPSKYMGKEWMDEKGYDKSQFLYYDATTKKISFYNDLTNQLDVYDFSRGVDPSKVAPALARALMNKYVKIDPERANSNETMGHPITIGEVSIKQGDTYKEFLVRNGFIQTDNDHTEFRDPVINFTFKIGEPTTSDIANHVTGGESTGKKVNTKGQLKIKSTVTEGTVTDRPTDREWEEPETSNQKPPKEPDSKVAATPEDKGEKNQENILTEAGAVVKSPSTALPVDMKYIGTYSSYKDAVKAMSVSLLEKMIGGNDPTSGDVEWGKKALVDLMKGEIDTFNSKLADPNIISDENAKAFYEKAINIRTEMIDHADQVSTDVLSWIKDWGGLKEFTDSFGQDDEFGMQYNYTVGRDMVDPLTFCSERLDAVMAILSTSQLSETTTFPTFYDHSKVAGLLMREFGGKASSLEDLKKQIESKANGNAVVKKFWEQIKGDDELERAAYSLFSKQLVNFADVKVNKDGTVSITESKSRGSRLIDKWTKGLFNRWEGAPLDEVQDARANILDAYNKYGRRTGDEPMAGQTLIRQSVENGETFKDYVDTVVKVLHATGVPVNDNTSGILEGIAESYMQQNDKLFEQYTKGGAFQDLSLIYSLEGAMRGFLGPDVEMPDHLKGVSPSLFAESMNVIRFIGEGNEFIKDPETGKQIKSTAILYQKSPTIRRLCQLLSDNGAELKQSFVWGPDHTKRYIYRDPCALSDIFQHNMSDPEYIQRIASNEYNLGNETLKRISSVIEGGGKQTGLKMQEVLNISGWGGKKVGYRDASGADIMLSHINAILQGKAVYRQMSEKPKFLLIDGISKAPTHLSNHEFSKHLVNGHVRGEITAIDTAHKARANFLDHLDFGDGKTIGKKEINEFNKLSGEEQRKRIEKSGFHTLKEFGLREGYHYKYVEEKGEEGRVTGHKIELSGKGYGYRMFDCLPEYGDSVNLGESAQDRDFKIRSMCASEKVINSVYDNLNKSIGNFLESLARKGIIRLEGNTGDDRLMDVRHNINESTRKPFFDIPDHTELGDAGFDLIQQRVEKYSEKHGTVSQDTVPLMVALRKVAMSSIWHDLEMNGFIEGDPAAMGGYANQTKRVQGLNSPGIKFANDFPEGHEFFGKKAYKRLHIHDPVINNPEIADVMAEKRAKAMVEIAKGQPRFEGKSPEEIYDTCLKEAKETVKGIANTMPTDGQSLITPSAAREWLIRLHRWSPAQEEAFQSWKKGDVSGDVLDNIMSTVLKCVYWGEETANQMMPDGTTVPVSAPEFHKTSYALLFSNDKSSWNYKMMEWAEKNKIDVIACGSASKTFGSDRMELINADGQLIDGFDGAMNYVEEHSFDNLRWQVPLPAHGQTMDHLGRQPGNIIFSGANESQATTLGKHYVNIMKSIINRHLNEGDISRTIFSMGARNGEATDNSIEAYAQGVPLSWIKNRSLIDNTLKGVSKCLQTTLPSIHAVEVTAIGRDNLQMIDKHGLAEIEVNMNQLAFMFPKGCGFEKAKQLFEKAKEDLGGKIEGLHYRVPTQGITSMAHTNVKNIIPNTGGDVIHAPFELAHVLGSDKDGDTLYGHGMRYVWKCTNPENMKISSKLLGGFLKHINGRAVTTVPGERGIGAVKDKVEFDYMHEAHRWAMDHNAVYDEKTGNFLLPKNGQKLIDNIKYVELGHESSPEEYVQKRENSYVYHGNNALKEMFNIMGTDKAIVQETSSVDGPVKAAKDYIYSITPSNELSGLMKLGVNGREISRTNNQGSQDDIGPSAITGKVMGLFNIITEGKSVIEQLQKAEKRTGATLSHVNTGVLVKDTKGKSSPLFVNVSLVNEGRAAGGGLFNVEGKLIGDDLTALISMAVDGGKDPVLPQGNINKKTIGAVCLLQAEGYGNSAYALVNTPIVRDLVDMPMSDQMTAVQEKSLLKRYLGLPDQATDGDLNLKLKDFTKNTISMASSKGMLKELSEQYKEYMDNGVPFDKWSDSFKEENIKAYFLFKAAKSEGQILANVANIMQLDGDGVGKTFGKCFRTWKNLKELGVVNEDYSVVDNNIDTPPLAQALMKTYIGEKVNSAGKIMKQLQEEGDLGFSSHVFRLMDKMVDNYLPFGATDDMVDDAHKVTVRSMWSHLLDRVGVDTESLYKGENTAWDAFWLLESMGGLDPNNEAVAHIKANTPRAVGDVKAICFDVKDITDNKMEGHMMDALRKMEQTASFNGLDKEFSDFKNKLVLYSYLADGNNTISHLLPPEWIGGVEEIQQAVMLMRSMNDGDDYKNFELSVMSNIVGNIDLADGKSAVDTPGGLKIGGTTLDIAVADETSKLPTLFSAMLKFQENPDGNPQDELQVVRYKKYGLDKDEVALYKNFGGDIWVKVPDSAEKLGGKWDTSIAGVMGEGAMENIYVEALKSLSPEERDYLSKASSMDINLEIDRIENKDTNVDRKYAYLDQQEKPVSEQPTGEGEEGVEQVYDEEEQTEQTGDATGTKEDLTYTQPESHFNISGKDVEVYDHLDDIDPTDNPTVIGQELVDEYKKSYNGKFAWKDMLNVIDSKMTEGDRIVIGGTMEIPSNQIKNLNNILHKFGVHAEKADWIPKSTVTFSVVGNHTSGEPIFAASPEHLQKMGERAKSITDMTLIEMKNMDNPYTNLIQNVNQLNYVTDKHPEIMHLMSSLIASNGEMAPIEVAKEAGYDAAAIEKFAYGQKSGVIMEHILKTRFADDGLEESWANQYKEMSNLEKEELVDKLLNC